MRIQVRRFVLIASAVVAVAACTSADESTTSTSVADTTTTAPAITTSTLDPALDAPLPVDDAVHVGVLDNGFTYYLRENDSPGGRMEMRLVVDAGSVQEAPDQAGMAHFLEHMMFNGTERFPRNELISILESFGPRFGPDINAYTTFDETVYELSLATDEELIELGLDVLREWASRATLTMTDVVEERGVVLDEWRVRTQGYAGRVSNELTSLILGGSDYDGHLPIGTPDSIQSATPEVLQRFYEDWYRPERMALVAVGDFDLAEMEGSVIDVFEDLEGSEEAPTWVPIDFEEPEEARAARFVDEEAAQASLTVLYPVERATSTSVGAYQEAVATALGLQVLGERLNELALDDDSPLLSGSPVDTGWTRVVGVRGVDVEVRAARATAALDLVLAELELMRVDGMTLDEFDRALSGFASASQQRFDQRESAQDVEFTETIVSHQLGDTPMMSPEQRFEVESGIVARLSLEDVNTALSNLLSGAPAVLALGPDDVGLDIPDASRILAAIAEVGDGPMISREPSDSPESLMARPDPVEPVSSSVDEQFGYTTLEYENGATVFLWESDISANGVYALVEGFGGTSVVSVHDLPEADLMLEIANRSGLGALEAAGLRRALSDRLADLRLFLTETRQGMEGSASTQDLETLLQLIHLTMVDPRLSQSATDAILDEYRTLNASRADLPSLLFEEALAEAYYGDDPRYFVVPSDEQLATFDLDVARRVFLERFGDPGQFAFVFVGDFDVADVTPLVSSYIGTVPPGPAPAGYEDNQPLPPREVQVAEVAAGAGDQGQVGLFFTNEFEATPRDRVTSRLVELILTSRLRDRIREELSATYSISAGIDLQRDPDPFAEAFIVSSGDPGGLDQIVDEAVAVLADLQRNGPTNAEFATAVAQMEDQLALLDNGTIAIALVTQHLYPDQPFVELSQRRFLLQELTPEDVRTMTGAVFDLDQRIEIRQVPRG